MTEEILTVKERVLKFRNSKVRYLKIAENEFMEITHGDIAEVIKKETDKHIDLIYRFNKPIINNPKKGKINKITTNIKKG